MDEKLSTSPWAREAKEHWRRNRPKMYKALEAKGTLNCNPPRFSPSSQPCFLKVSPLGREGYARA